MAHLNWKNAPIRQEIVPHPELRNQLTLRASAEALTELASALEEKILQAGEELRLDLPKEWAIFWKRRDGETRLLLAHPEPEVWVATAALEAQFAEKLVRRLKKLQTGDTLTLSEIGPLGSVSNLEIVFKLDGLG